MILDVQVYEEKVIMVSSTPNLVKNFYKKKKKKKIFYQ